MDLMKPIKCNGGSMGTLVLKKELNFVRCIQWKASLYTTIVHMNTTVIIMYNKNVILKSMIQGVSESSHN